MPAEFADNLSLLFDDSGFGLSRTRRYAVTEVTYLIKFFRNKCLAC
jgi:hypothetical protein